MAYETITQILAPTNAPYINGINGERRISAAILKASFQGLVEKNGKGVDDNYVTSSDAEEATQIVVHRVLPVRIKPREFGASKNGGSYSQNQHYVQTEEVGIDILQVLDDVILLPRASTDRIKVDLLAEQIQIFSDRWATIYNGATTASKILATYLKKAKTSNNEINEVYLNIDKNDSDNDIAKKRILDKFIEGHSLLDEGDPEHGIDVFPANTQVAVFRVSFRAILKAGAVLTLGGANEAYAILAGSGINNKGDAKVIDDGYVGEIDGVEVRLISNESLGHAAQFLGFPEGEFKKDGYFCGYIASSYANARGSSTRERTQVVQEVNGQGIRLLPYIKFGAVCWYPLGNVFFVSNESYNPFKDLRDLVKAATGEEEVTFKLKSWGSRLFPAPAAPVTITSSTTFTIGAVLANDDWGRDHTLACYYVVTDTPCKTVAQFLSNKDDAVDFGATDGTVTLDNALTSGKYVSVLAISDDGSCYLSTTEYVA